MCLVFRITILEEQLHEARSETKESVGQESQKYSAALVCYALLLYFGLFQASSSDRHQGFSLIRPFGYFLLFRHFFGCLEIS